MAKKSILERQIAYYPNYKYHRMFIAWCYKEDLKKAEGALQIHENFFKDRFSDEQQNNLLSLYDSLTLEERKLLRK